MIPSPDRAPAPLDKATEEFLFATYGPSMKPAPVAHPLPEVNAGDPYTLGHPQTFGEALFDWDGDLRPGYADLPPLAMSSVPEYMDAFSESILDLYGTVLKALAPLLTPLLSLVGGWPLALLAGIGIRVAMQQTAKRPATTVLYQVPRNEVRSFLNSLGASDIKVNHVIADKGLVSVNRSDMRTVDEIAYAYKKLSGVAIRRLGK